MLPPGRGVTVSFLDYCLTYRTCLGRSTRCGRTASMSGRGKYFLRNGYNTTDGALLSFSKTRFGARGCFAGQSDQNVILCGAYKRAAHYTETVLGTGSIAGRSMTCFGCQYSLTGSTLLIGGTGCLRTGSMSRRCCEYIVASDTCLISCTCCRSTGGVSRCLRKNFATRRTDLRCRTSSRCSGGVSGFSIENRAAGGTYLVRGTRCCITRLVPGVSNENYTTVFTRLVCGTRSSIAGLMSERVCHGRTAGVAYLGICTGCLVYALTRVRGYVDVFYGDKMTGLISSGVVSKIGNCTKLYTDRLSLPIA